MQTCRMRQSRCLCASVHQLLWNSPIRTHLQTFLPDVRIMEVGRQLVASFQLRVKLWDALQEVEAVDLGNARARPSRCIVSCLGFRQVPAQEVPTRESVNGKQVNAVWLLHLGCCISAIAWRLVQRGVDVQEHAAEHALTRKT
eukprot:351612-Chlamydomonas_euryale.AAC.28